MSRIDNIALANKKNFVDKTRLKSEIHRIDREKSTVMRLLNNEKQRFKSKYSKFDVFSEHRGTEPSDVVMYTTHNPGFCYRRNGECRMPPSPIKSTSLGFEDIHVLIFTDGELDIDKVLCLHLLSAHRTDTLTPPPREQRAMMFLAKQQAPLERLIERTKRRWPEHKLTRFLPIYVIEYSRNNPQNKGDNLIRDGRLAARLIVNEKVNILIGSIMTALEKTNKSMLNDLIEKSRSKEYLKLMVNKPKIQDFVKNLNGLNVISCCESFCLTIPFRVIPVVLEVRTSSCQLENLVKQIRKNIFKLPINCCWDEDYSAFGSLSNLDNDNSPFLEYSFLYGEREIFSQNLDVFDSRIKGKSTQARRSQTPSIEESSDETPRNINEPPLADITNTVETPKQNVVERNVILSRKRSIINTKKSRSGKEFERPDKWLNPQQMKDVDFEKVANLLYKKANVAIRRDLENLEKKRSAGSKLRIQKNSSEEPVKGGEEILKHPKSRILLKQTKCVACCEKWREPLPSPKTSHINKNVIHPLDDDTLQEIMTNSSHLLSSLIDQEMKFWKEYKALKKETRPGTPGYKFSATNSFDKNSIIEIIDMNELDLAKVRQEIREHETKKKLEQFLNS